MHIRRLSKLVSIAQVIAFTVGFSKPAFAFPVTLPEPTPGESQAISVMGSTVKIRGITDPENKLFINGRPVPILKDASFEQEIIVPVGETRIVVSVLDKGGFIREYSKKITAKENYFFLVGIADGTLNLGRTDDGTEWKRDSHSYAGGLVTTGKVSYYFAGKVKGKYLIKSALDTDKAVQEKLFTNIDPDKYYPIYGDHSSVTYDVNSQGKFYLLTEWDKSGFTLGNYQTQLEDEQEAQLSNYQRTLYGGKLHLETLKRTVYGESAGRVTAFVAEANQSAGHSEFLATGGSLYYLRHRNIVEGSERVRLQVRDKQTGMVLSTTDQAENADYEIKYSEGRILFKKPVLSVARSDTIINNSPSALEGNPVYVLVDYEFKSQEAFPVTFAEVGQKTGGVRVSQHIGNHLRIGGTYVQEEKEGKHHELMGTDTTLRLGNFTRLDAEAAHSMELERTSYFSNNGGFNFSELSLGKDVKGSAQRVKLNSSMGEYFGLGKDFLDLSGYWQQVGQKFSPVGSLFEGGTRKTGGSLAHRFTEHDQVRFLFDRGILRRQTNQEAKDQLTAQRVDNYTSQWTHQQGKWTMTTEHLYAHKKQSFSSVFEPGQSRVGQHTVAERVQYELSRRTSLFVGQQLGLSASRDTMTSAGISQQVSDTVHLHAQASKGFHKRDSFLVGLDKVIDANTTTYVNYSQDQSPLEGKVATTSFGSSARLSETARLRSERQFISTDSRGSYATHLTGYEHQITPQMGLELTYQRREERLDANLNGPVPRDTVSTNLSYTDKDFLKAFAKFEYRIDNDKRHLFLWDDQIELKLSEDISLFGEYQQSLSDVASHIDKKEAGLAYRPVRWDWFNALFKYIRFRDKRPDALTSPDGGFTLNDSTSDTYASEFAVDLPFRFQVVEKFAYKDERVVAFNSTGTIRTPESLRAFLNVHRVNYHLTKKADAAVEYRTLDEDGSALGVLQNGFLLEGTYRLVDHIAVGVGYNFSGFTDDFTGRSRKRAEGFFARLQGRY